MRIGAEFHDENDVRYLLRHLDVHSYDQALSIVKTRLMAGCAMGASVPIMRRMVELSMRSAGPTPHAFIIPRGES